LLRIIIGECEKGWRGVNSFELSRQMEEALCRFKGPGQNFVKQSQSKNSLPKLENILSLGKLKMKSEE